MKKLAITLMIILGVGISFDTSAQFNQFKELKNLVGGEEKEEKSDLNKI